MMIQIITEKKGPNDFLCINDLVQDLAIQHSGDYNIEWKDRNHNAWNKRFKTEHYKNITIQEYDASYPAYYLVTMPHTIDRFNTIWARFLTQDTINILKQHNIPILLSQPLEHTHDYIDVGQNNLNRLDHKIMSLDTLLSSKGLNTNNIAIHGISKVHRQPHKLNQRKIFDIFSTEFLNQGKFYLDQDDSHYNSLVKFEDHIKYENIKSKTFIFLNRLLRDIRCLSALKLTPYLDKGVFTFLGIDIGQELTKDELKERIELICNVSNVPEEKDKITTFLRNFPYKMHLDDTDNQRLNHIINQQRREVYYELVAETHDMNIFDKDISILSEKILWPILNHLPFLVIGHRRNHEFLRDLGFKTFEHLFLNNNDHRYAGTDVREFLTSLEQAVNHYNNLGCNIEFYKSLEEDLKFNFNHLVNTDWFKTESEWLIANQSI